MNHRAAFALCCLPTLVVLAACSGEPDDAKSDSAATGGRPGASGGNATTTGTAATGGIGSTSTTSQGGSTGTGNATGGTISSGGTVSTGGKSATGGEASGGAVSTGGKSATGGEASGGAVATGGKSATGGEASGGAVATGGKSATGGEASGGAVSTGGKSATGGVTSNGGQGGAAGATPSTLPTATGACPELVTGMVSFLGSNVSLSVGPANKPGPMLFYWHATGMTYTEVESGFSDVIDEVKANGGVVASFTTTTSTGTNTGNGVWYTGDIAVADEVLACAIKQGLVDTRRIHVSGYSAGGLQCAAMSYLRSGYVASVLCMSGGFMSTMSTYTLQDTSHVPAAIAAHGAAGSDVFILDFSTCSDNYCKSVASKGGLAINCNDGGDHITSMTKRAATMGPVAWKFFAENQYGSDNHYPSGLPSYFPSYCTIAQ